MKGIDNYLNINNNNEYLEALEDIKRQLPIQAPMTFFVHNNPLMHYEKYPYEEGMRQAFLTYTNAIENNTRHIWRELEDFLLPILNSYFDQGINNWSSPAEKEGLWSWYVNYVEKSSILKSEILKNLKTKIEIFNENYRKHDLQFLDLTLKDRIKKEKNKSSIKKEEATKLYLQAMIFHFKGWSGMISFLENNHDKFPLQKVPIKFLDWVTILVVTESALYEIKKKPRLIWDLTRFNRENNEIINKISKCKEREVKFYKQIVTQFENHLVMIRDDFNSEEKNQNSIAMLFCIDDREESLRRHIESMSPNYKTYGTVGFFGIDYSLRKANDVIHKPQCPPVITPTKKAHEVESSKTTTFNKAIRYIINCINYGNFTGPNAILSILFSPLIAILLLIRTHRPKMYLGLKSHMTSLKDAYVNKKIIFETDYLILEKCKIVKDILYSAGMVKIESKLVYLVSHGSSSQNNPFVQAYGCGACSGENGLANARIFCDWANSFEISSELKNQGIYISKETIFYPICHDTSLDQVFFGNTMENKEIVLSTDHEILHNKFKIDIQNALKLNQIERWEQFSLDKRKDNAENRSLHWGEPRPEFGHNQVSMAIFAPRFITKNLNLNRKSFLISYDPSLDEHGDALAFNILNALPVCANINLDYLTSSAYSEAFGAGSKLPLNVASGIGLISGSKSDLKIGLANQMTDRHDANRLLVFVYAQKELLDLVISKSERLKRILKNNWIHVLLISPNDYSLSSYTSEINSILNVKTSNSLNSQSSINDELR